MKIWDQVESKGAMLCLVFVLGVAAGLEFSGHLSPGMVSVLEWVGGSYMGAQGAAHIGCGMQSPQPEIHRVDIPQ